MIDKKASWWHRGISYSFLLAITIMVWQGGQILNEIRNSSFDNAEQKWKVVTFVDTFDLSQAEVIAIMTHVSDSMSHISAKERITYYERMSLNDSLINLFIIEQWKQGRRLERIEDTVNQLVIIK